VELHGISMDSQE